MWQERASNKALDDANARTISNFLCKCKQRYKTIKRMRFKAWEIYLTIHTILIEIDFEIKRMQRGNTAKRSGKHLEGHELVEYNCKNVGRFSNDLWQDFGW